MNAKKPFVLRSFSIRRKPRPKVLLNGKPAELIQNYGRIVAKRNDIVVKIDAYAADCDALYSQTLFEIESWYKIKASDRKYFPIILSHGEVLYGKRKIFWLAQPYYKLDKRNLLPAAKKKVSNLVNKYDLKDLSGFEHGSDCSYNWGMDLNTKKPVIYDFGFTY